ncbi:MAG TPA: hypothetical protein VFE61_10245 [Candidatus Sulfotelmatobacter sp.]|nr:hypothetical protein [Candidatus Sulfotelmatobacter sp.]
MQDFPLPFQNTRELFLRQIITNQESARINELWWALYDDGMRSDVWYFKADPRRTDGKALSNYQLEEVLKSGQNSVALRVHGEMFRPQGAWWIVGKMFGFSLADRNVGLTRVQNSFGFFQDYDIGTSPAGINVSTEHEVNEELETHTYESVPDRVLSACGFRDPQSDAGWEFNWLVFERVALCVTAKPDARPSRRKRDQPSFVELGGKTSP